MMNTFEGIVIMPRMMPFKTKFLPDYQIDWNIPFEDCSIPMRNVQELKYFNAKI